MSEAGSEQAKGFTSSALLVAAVAAIMVAGMLLRSSDPTAAPRPSGVTASPAPSLPLGSTISPELPPALAAAESTPDPAPAPAPSPETVPRAEPEASASPLVVKLANRAEADCGRLEQARGRWTAQLVVACKPETVDRLLGAARGSTKLHVLPAQVRDQACFRVCFGDYATSREAAAAADLPKALRGKDSIRAVEIAKVLP